MAHTSCTNDKFTQALRNGRAGGIHLCETLIIMLVPIDQLHRVLDDNVVSAMTGGNESAIASLVKLTHENW